MTQLITNSDDLAAFCQRLADEPFITLDTEFLREKTYFPQLCLVQIGGEHEAAAIDPLAKDIDLSSMWELLANENILKVLHAARQDLEIFYHLTQNVPKPLFDTQIAAQVLGLGDNLGYEALIRKRLNTQIDKGQRFTDWARRPLTDSQLTYAIGDVTHLRGAYLSLKAELIERDREGWIAAEMQALEQDQLHYNDPEHSWKRVKIRAKNNRQLGHLKQLASWREQTAQTANVPRQRVVKDETLAEIAINLPKTEDQMLRMRGFPKHMKSTWREQLWKLCSMLPELPESEFPEFHKSKRISACTEGRLEMLRLFMKQVSREHDVSSSFIATRDQLESFAKDPEDESSPLTQGWRKLVFGDNAQSLMQGKKAAMLDPETGDIRFADI